MAAHRTTLTPYEADVMLRIRELGKVGIRITVQDGAVTMQGAARVVSDDVQAWVMEHLETIRDVLAEGRA